MKKDLLINKIDLKAATVFLRKDAIIHIHIKAGSDMELDDAAEVVDAMGKLGKGVKYPVLIDAGEYAHIDKEVRIFSASPESNIYTIADAVVYHSFAQKLIADFYVKQNKPVIPTQVFPSIDEALIWLKTFSKQ